MNDYNDYMNNISADPALCDNIMAKTAKPARAFYKRPAFVALAAGMAVVLIGVLAIPGLLDSPQRLSEFVQMAPEEEAASYYGMVGAGNVPNTFHDRRPDDDSDTVIVRDSDPYTPIPGRPVSPAPERIELTLQQARHDPDFGTLIPANIPDDFSFESAQRTGDTLVVSWNRGVGRFDHTTWVVHFSDEHWGGNIADPSQPEQFDVALYPIPWADTVPEEYREVFHFPVFCAEDLSLAVVQARMMRDSRTGGGWQYAPFAVLYGEVLVQPRVNGVTPEQLYEMLASLS